MERNANSKHGKGERPFQASINIHIGDGQTALFWHDNWLNDTPLKDRAPNLYKLTRRKVRTVVQEMENKNWIRAVRNIFIAEQLREYVDIWILLRHVTLVQGTKDVVRWKWTANGEYNHALLIGPNSLECTGHLTPTCSGGTKGDHVCMVSTTRKNSNS